MNIRSPSDSATSLGGAGATFVNEGQLLREVEEYLRPDDVEHVAHVLAYAKELRDAQRERTREASALAQTVPGWDFDYGVSVAQTLAGSIHIDAISLAAVLLYQAVEGNLVTLDDIRARLGGTFADDVVQTISNIERFDSLQRPAAALRRTAAQSATEPEDASRRRPRERQRQQDTESIRKMFVAMSEDPRVAVFKIADQLRTMRAVREAADYWLARQATDGTTAESSSAVGEASSLATEPRWTPDECRVLAQETREIYAPLAARLGMGRVEGELEDLAFAVLEPEEYHWLRDAVAGYTEERGSYVDRVCRLLRQELRAVGLEPEVTGRLKHLYSIYKKVQRTGSHDISNLYDILAFRIIVDSVEQCYIALGHVHALWRPKDGRIKDFIANPKPNGYQSLHTTVFCLDDRLAEIQIRTRAMHQMAEYGVAMHWYYKDTGDAASAQAKPLQSWVQQVHEWQQELQGGGQTAAERALEVVKGDVLKEQIFVFTPAGDVKELPAGSTPLDFAYRVHTDVGNHVSGVRVTSTDTSGRLVKKLVPLDYELKSGDVVEILKRKDAHPTRDWLHVVRTKTARDRIRKYLEAHERDIDLQIGRERLDRELRTFGLRKGFEDLTEEDLSWLTKALEQPDVESLLVAIGSDKLRLSAVMGRLRERLLPPAAEVAVEESAPAAAPARETQAGANVAGVSGMLTQLANCCDPLPGDELRGYISRGRGVVIHRADCATLAHLLQRQPDREVAVEWPAKLEGQQGFRAPIVIAALDRTGLLADVTGIITGMKINMLSVSTVTRPKQRQAVITATLEIQRPDQLLAAIKELQKVPGVQTVERKKAGR